MQKFNFDFQRFAITFEFSNGTKTFADRGWIGSGSTAYTYWDEIENRSETRYASYEIYQYYPSETWNDYLRFQNHKSNKLTVINEYRYDSNELENFQKTASGETFSGDYRILRGGDAQYHMLENYQANYVQMYGRNDGCVLNNDGGNYAYLVGGAGNDYITNSRGYSVTINGGNGNDNIENYAGDSGTINGGNDNDTINNRSGRHVTINGGAGNDKIENSDAFVSIAGEAGNDYIYNYSSNVTINGGTGNDIINNTVRNYYVKIDAGADNDEIYNHCEVSTINGGTGNDSIVNRGASVTIFGGDDDDTITNTGASVSIDAGAGNDSIVNHARSVSIYASFGNDTVENYGAYAFIDTGDEYAQTGKDSVANYADHATIQGGGGTDFIKNSSRGVSINGGAGSDIISLHSAVPIGDVVTALVNPLKDLGKSLLADVLGVDVFEFKNCLEIVADETKSDKEKKAALEKFTQPYSDKAFDGALDNLLADNEAFRKINAFRNAWNKVVGRFQFLTNVTGIAARYMSDPILAAFAKQAFSSFAEAFEKDDNGRWCFAWEAPEQERTTVRGGKDGDEIYSDGLTFHIYEYAAGDGNDTIYGWNLNDTLSITGGNYSTTKVGNDFVVKVGDGSILFKDYYTRDVLRTNSRWEFTPVEIVCEDGTEEIPATPANNTKIYFPPPEGISVNEHTVKAADDFSGMIDVSEGYCSAATKVDAGYASSVTIFGNESVRNVTSGKGHDKIYITSTRTTIFSGAGNDLIVGEGNDNSIEAGAGDDTILSDGENNLIIYGAGDGNDTIYGFNDTSTLSISSDTYSTTKSGEDLIVKVGNGSITLKDAASLKSSIHISGAEPTADEKIIQGTNKADKITNSNDDVTIQALGGNDNIANGGSNVIIDAGAGNDNVKNGGSNVTVDGGAGNDKITLSGGTGGNIFVCSAGCGKDVVYNFQSNDTIKIADDSKPAVSVNGKDVILTFDKNNFVTLKDAATGTGKTITLVDNNGEIISAATYSSVGITQGDSIMLNASFNKTLAADSYSTIDAKSVKKLNISFGDNAIEKISATDSTIVLSYGDDDSLTLHNVKNNTVTIGKTAYKFADGLMLNTAESAATLMADNSTFDAADFFKLATIDASRTSDATITGNAKANKILLGGGENTFVWLAKGGNDTIYNFDAGEDLVSISGAAVTDASVTKKGTTVLTVGKNKLTFDNTNEVKFADDDGTKIFDGGIFFDADETSATLGSAVKDFTATGNVTSVTGNDKANKLHANATGSTLDGGKGNDSLWGSGGADTFIYETGGGKDVVFGFGEDDLLEIIGLGDNVTGKFNKTGTELTVKVGKTTAFVLKDFTATTFNVTADGKTFALTK